jgi:hypothetical protein
MLVKKPGNQLLQLELTGRVIHRSSALKELPLDFSRKIIPLHDHQNSHGVAGSRIDESTLPIYRNATGALMDCLTALKI